MAERNWPKLVEEGEKEGVSVGREKRNARVGTLNVGTMTGKGSELVDRMQRRKVDTLCPGDQPER